MNCFHDQAPCNLRALLSRRSLFGLLVVALLIMPPKADASIGTYLLDESFNSMTTNAVPTNGWNTTSTGGGSIVVKELPFAADKSVRIQKLNNSGESTLYRTLPNYGGKMAFEAKVMMREATPFHVCPYIYDSNNNPVVSIGFSNGNIVAYDKASSAFLNIQTFNINDWYMIRVVINTATNTYDLYIDGVRKLQNAPVRTNPAGGVLGALKFYMDSTNIGTMYSRPGQNLGAERFHRCTPLAGFRCPELRRHGRRHDQRYRCHSECNQRLHRNRWFGSPNERQFCSRHALLAEQYDILHRLFS